MAILYGLHHLPLTHSFPEHHSRDPAILHQQWVEEAKSSTNQAVCAEDPAVQWLLGPIALSFLLGACNQAHQGDTGLR